MSDEPLILSIDTSDVSLGVDLSAGGDSLARRVLVEPRIHASMLMPTVIEILDDSGRSMNELDGVAVAMGPGSYTGLRIGVSSAKGIAYALGIPLMGVPTMHALAFGFPHTAEPNALITCLTSRRDEVYVQVWDISGEPEALTEVDAVQLDGLPEFLAGSGRSAFAVIGSATDILLKSMSDSNSFTLYRPASDGTNPTVHGVSALGLRRFRTADFEDISAFEPAYLKDFVAKRGASPFDAARDR